MLSIICCSSQKYIKNHLYVELSLKKNARSLNKMGVGWFFVFLASETVNHNVL